MDEPATTELLRELAQRYHVPGLQFAWYDNGRVTTIELGRLRNTRDDLVHADSRFPLGSVGKLAVATVVMQMVGDGDVALDAPFGDYVPWAAGALAPVTLRQLLSHTSGLPDLPAGELGPRVPLKRHVLAARDMEPVCRPGFFSYSNFGYVLVSCLIETVLGMRWWEAVRSFVLDPLEATCAVPGMGEAGQHAVHLPTGRVEAVEPELPASVVACGTMAMCAGDLLKLATIHCVPNAVLRSAQLEEMRRPVGAEPFGLAEAWGLGLALFGGGTWLGHDGYTGGATCTVRMSPARQNAMVLMTNATSGRWLGNQLLDAVGVGCHQVPDPGEALRGAELRAVAAELTGVYRSGDRVIDVRLGADGELCFGGSRISLRPNLVFTVDGDDFPDNHRFLRSPHTGRVDGLQFGGARVMARQI